jgi:hypothetical protein
MGGKNAGKKQNIRVHQRPSAVLSNFHAAKWNAERSDAEW